MSNSGLLEAFMQSRTALLRYLVLRGAPADEGEDVLQEVFVRLSTDSIGPVDQPRAYLYRMATNQLLLQRRTGSRRGRREELWTDLHSGDSREIDEAPSVEARLIAREKLTILQHALDALPERTRDIFRRFRIEGEPQRAIAADIEISVSAVEKHLARAYDAIATVKLQFDEETGPPGTLRGSRRPHGD